MASNIKQFFTSWVHNKRESIVEIYAEAIRKELSKASYPPASSPGESPHYRTRQLLHSVKVEKTSTGARVIVTAPYATFLQYGTSKMKPRPFLTNALKHVGWINRAIIAVLGKGK